MKNETTKKATLTVTGSLEDFLKTRGANQPLKITFELQPSVKDIIESQGIPHTAIFGLTVNGKERSLDYNLKEGDKITAYPVEAINNTEINPVFLQPKAFICDVHLGKLAKTMRLLGFDVSFSKRWDDPEIIRHSNQQKRMILTRDLELLKNGNTRYGYWVRSTDPDRQIEELFYRFFLSDNIDPFSRCMKCNGILDSVSPDQVSDRIPPKVEKWHSQFWQCENCGQVYWQGSHFDDLKEKVAHLSNLSS